VIVPDATDCAYKCIRVLILIFESSFVRLGNSMRFLLKFSFVYLHFGSLRTHQATRKQLISWCSKDKFSSLTYRRRGIISILLRREQSLRHAMTLSCTSTNLVHLFCEQQWNGQFFGNSPARSCSRNTYSNILAVCSILSARGSQVRRCGRAF